MTDEERVLHSAREIFWSKKVRRSWYENARPPYWQGKTPKQLVEEGRVDEVLAWIEAIKGGVFW